MPLSAVIQFGSIPFPPLRINHITSKDWAAFLKYSATNFIIAVETNQKTETKEIKIIGGRGWTGEEHEEKEG